MIEFMTAASPLQWLVALFVMIVTDIAWARYSIAAAQENNPLMASGWAVILFLLGGLAVVGYTKYPVLLIPSALGAFLGTYIGVVLSRKEKK